MKRNTTIRNTREFVMKKIWIRLGGYVIVDDNVVSKITNGSGKALIEAIKKSGFEVNGESYIPDDENGDVDFDIGPIKLEYNKKDSSPND